MADYTKEDLETAKLVPMSQVLQACGMDIRKIGSSTVCGVDTRGMAADGDLSSVRIYKDQSWYRWSNRTGGSPIDWMIKIMGLSLEEAVIELCGLQRKGMAYSSSASLFSKECKAQERNAIPLAVQNPKEKQLQLPKKNMDNRRLYGYLIRARHISYECVRFFHQEKQLMYESEVHHNIVFLGKDKEGKIRFASMRGTSGSFKCDVAGNDKNYGFCLQDKDSTEVQVFEGAIDLISYCDLYKEYRGNKLSLGMVCDHPLERFLKEHKQIQKIIFSLDMDSKGRKASRELYEKYQLLGYEVEEKLPEQGKDFNEYLSLCKEKKILFRHPVSHEEYQERKVLCQVTKFVLEKIKESGEEIELKGIQIYGSRSTGNEREDSDLDILVQYEGTIREDDFFTMLNTDPMYQEDIRVDINPIQKEKSGTINQFMERNQKVYPQAPSR